MLIAIRQRLTCADVQDKDLDVFSVYYES